MPSEQEYKKYAFYIILGVIGYLVYLLTKPYLTYIALGAVLSLASYPLYQKILSKTKKNKLSAAVTIIIIILIIVIPSFILISSLVKETVNFFTNLDQQTINMIAEKISQITGEDTQVAQYLNKAISSSGQFLMSWTFNIIGSATQATIGLFIMLSIIYYALLDGKEWLNKAKAFMPLTPSQRESLLNKINSVTKTVIYGEIMIAAVQGILGGIIFALVGIPNPIFWGFMTALLAFLPFVGSGLVWVPAAIIKMLQGDIIIGIFLLIYGAVVIGGVDYYIRPKLIAGASRIHPITALIGAFGGIQVFGFTGLILGPLIASIFEALIYFHYEDSLKIKKSKLKTK